MTPTDIDRILGDEIGIEPSARFTSRAMRAVRADAAERRAHKLAWRQAWPVAAAASVLGPLSIASSILGEPTPVDPILLLTFTIIGTATLVSWCTGLVIRH